MQIVCIINGFVVLVLSWKPKQIFGFLCNEYSPVIYRTLAVYAYTHVHPTAIYSLHVCPYNGRISIHVRPSDGWISMHVRPMATCASVQQLYIHTCTPYKHKTLAFTLNTSHKLYTHLVPYCLFAVINYQTSNAERGPISWQAFFLRHG